MQAIIAMDPAALREYVSGTCGQAELAAHGAMTIEGSHRDAVTFLDVFDLAVEPVFFHLR